MKEIISSSQNKYIKHVKSLHTKKNRDNLNQYIIEGFKLIEEALAYNKPFDYVLISETALEQNEGNSLLQKCEESSIANVIVGERVFLEVSEMENPQGALAVLYKQEQQLMDILGSSAFNIIILDEVRDPGNVGTIIRTADACAFDAVVLSKGCVDIYNSKTLRATMGSAFHIPVVTDVDILEFIARLKDMDSAVLGADPHSSLSCIDVSTGNRTAIVVGNESKGLRADVKDATTENITIPMPGKAESLNAGIAAAILMYEFAVRKK